VVAIAKKRNGAVGWLVLIGLLAAALYMVIVAGAYWKQRALLYHPGGARLAPGGFGLTNVADVSLTTPDGEKLVGWWSKAAPGKPTILYLHGNAGHLSERSERIRYFQTAGIGMFMLAYRGYSGSTGAPSEAANVADAALAFDHLVGTGVRSQDIVLFGESLGTGVAVQLAALRPDVPGMILDSPYTSMADAGAHHFPWLPVRALLTDRYDTLARIGGLHLPLLILHGEADFTVPVFMGRAVYAAANEPKKIVTFPGAQHILHAQFGSLDVVRDFVGALKR
jgi:uncharacterized protein